MTNSTYYYKSDRTTAASNYAHAKPGDRLGFYLYMLQGIDPATDSAISDAFKTMHRDGIIDHDAELDAWVLRCGSLAFIDDARALQVISLMNDDRATKATRKVYVDPQGNVIP